MRRRLPEATSGMVIAERRHAERMAAQEKAMRLSQHGGGGLSRRNTSFAGKAMGESILSGPSSPANRPKPIPSIDDSVKAVDESAINPFPPPEAQDIHPDDLVEDGGVGSELGGSYVDGKVARASRLSQPHESDRLEDGGMLGLLAQVYGGRGGGFGGGPM